MNSGDQSGRFPEYRPHTSQPFGHPVSVNASVPQNFPPFQYRYPNQVPWNAVPPPPFPNPPDYCQYTSYPTPQSLTLNRGRSDISHGSNTQESSNVSNQTSFLPGQHIVANKPSDYTISASCQPRLNNAPGSIKDTSTTLTASINSGCEAGFSPGQNILLPSFSHPPPFVRSLSHSFPIVPPPPPRFNIPPPGFGPRFLASETRNTVPPSQQSSENISSFKNIRTQSSHQSRFNDAAVASTSSLVHNHQSFTNSQSCVQEIINHERVTDQNDQTVISCRVDDWSSDPVNSSIQLPQNRLVKEPELSAAVWSTDSRRKDDLEWINNWSKSRRSRPTNSECLSRAKNISLTSFRNFLIEAIRLNDKLKDLVCEKHHRTNLVDNICHQSESGDTHSPNTCGRNVECRVMETGCEEDSSSVVAIQKRLIEIKDLITDEVVAGMKTKLRKIQNKRKNLKSRRQRVYDMKQKNLSVRAQVDQEIDNWQMGILAKQTKLKKEKEIQAAADETLFEVRRKLTEARRCLSLLDNIQKLRILRKDKASRKGMLLDTDPDETFAQRIAAQTDSFKKRIDMYELEERTLEVMLETEQEVNAEREKKIQKRKDEEKMKKFSRQLHAWLFGKDEPLSPSDPLFPYRQYYDIGSNNLAAFLRIRQEWDLYAVPYGTPGGSLVPFGWVKPVQPSSDIWASALSE